MNSEIWADAGGAHGAAEVHSGAVSGDRATAARRTVREIRDGLRTAPGRAAASPLWTGQVDWLLVRALKYRSPVPETIRAVVTD